MVAFVRRCGGEALRLDPDREGGVGSAAAAVASRSAAWRTVTGPPHGGQQGLPRARPVAEFHREPAPVTDEGCHPHTHITRPSEPEGRVARGDYARDRR